MFPKGVMVTIRGGGELLLNREMAYRDNNSRLNSAHSPDLSITHPLETEHPSAVPIIPLPGIRLPGFAPRHRGAWFQRIRKKLCYRSQFVSSCRSYSLVRLSTSMEGGDVFLSGSCHTMSSSFAPQGVRSISRGGAPCVLILTCPVDTC